MLHQVMKNIYVMNIGLKFIKFHLEHTLYCLNDGTKLSVLNTPSIQINLDLNNRHFSLKYFTNSYSKNFEIKFITFIKSN